MSADPWDKEFTPVAPQRGPQPQPTIAPVFTAPGDPLTTQGKEVSIAAQQQQMELERQRLELARIASQQSAQSNDRAASQQAEGQSQQQKDASFWLRAMSANADYGKVATVGPRGLAGQYMADNHPDATNSVASPERQQADQSQRAFINAVLRLESGAVIGTDEMTNYRRQYFPQPGDSEAVIKQKAHSREVAMASLEIGAGPLADTVRSKFSQLYPPESPQGQQEQTRDPEMVGGVVKGQPIKFGMDGGDGGSFDRSKYLQDQYGITGDRESQLVGFWDANAGNTGLTVAGVKNWYSHNNFPLPTDQDIAARIELAKKGVRGSGFDTSAAEKAYQAQLDAANKARGFDPGSADAGVGQLVHGASLNTSDELAGLVEGGKALINGENPVAGYQVGRDLERRQLEQSSAAHPYQSGFLNIAGTLFAPVGMVGDGAKALDYAKAGAKAGGVAGWGEGNGLADSVAGGVGGALVGGSVGGAVGKGAEVLAARRAAAASAGPSEGAQVIQAADDLNGRFGTNIRPLPADVGGPGTRMATGATATLPLGAPQVVRAATRVTQEAEKAKNAIAAIAGNASTPEAAGEAALQGAAKFIKTSKTKVDALYAKARQLGGSEPVDLAGARQVLDQNIAELSNVPGGGPGLAELKTLRAELDRPYPVDGVKAMRTTLRDRFLSDGLRGSDLERRVGQVVDAAEGDVATSLTNAGKPDAATAWQAAAQAHAERVDVIDNVLTPIIGKKGDKSVEDVMSAIDTATKTKGARLGKLLDALPPTDAATVRATLINRLGLVSKGRQDAEGTAFSLNDFLTHWNAMSGPAKSQLFGGELRSALENLAKVAQGTKEAQRFENSSKTGAAVGQIASGALLMRLFTEPTTAIAGFTLQAGMGKLMSSPAFARWLAKMPDNPSAASAHVRQLTKIATANPAISAEIIDFQRAVAQRIGGQMPLAAEPQQPGDRQPPLGPTSSAASTKTGPAQ